MTHRRTRPIALVITRNLPPLVGGMERLVWHIVDELRVDYRIHVIGPRGCGRHLPDGVTVSEIPIKPMPWFLLRCMWVGLVQTLRLRPTLVFAGSGLTAPFAWLAARLVRARCVVYVHGLDLIVRSVVYRFLWLPFIRRCDLVIANSDNTAKLARDTKVPVDRLCIVCPGAEAPPPDPAAARRFRSAHGFGDVPLLLAVGRLTARKGLPAFVACSLPEVIRQFSDVLLVVIGDEAQDALHRGVGSGRGAVVQAAEHVQIGSHVRLLGSCSESSLNDAYDAADVLVFPVLEVPGDVEGFGMVAIEAAAHGTPTVAFAVGGVPDAVADSVSGSLVPAGDYAQFAEAIRHWLDLRESKPISLSCREFAGRFAWPRFGEQLRRALSDTLSQVDRDVA